MLKKNLIVCILIFFYTIVLGHSAIPHGHFDDFFAKIEIDSQEHSHNDHDSQEHSHGDNDIQEHSHQHPPYLFSHSISLHVAIEKQSVFSAHSQKTSLKNSQPEFSVFLLPSVCQLSSCFGEYYPLLVYDSDSLPQLKYYSFISRGPPSVS